MNPPQVYMCSPSRTLLPPPSPHHPSGSSQCTSPKHPVSCIEPGLATRFIHDILSFVLFLKIICNVIAKVICLKMFIGLSPQILQKYSKSKCNALHLLDAHLIMSTGKERRLSISTSVYQKTTIMVLPSLITNTFYLFLKTKKKSRTRIFYN